MGLIIAKNIPVKPYHFSRGYLCETRPEPPPLPPVGRNRGKRRKTGPFGHRIGHRDPCAMARGASAGTSSAGMASAGTSSRRDGERRDGERRASSRRASSRRASSPRHRAGGHRAGGHRAGGHRAGGHRYRIRAPRATDPPYVSAGKRQASRGLINWRARGRQKNTPATGRGGARLWGRL